MTSLRIALVTDGLSPLTLGGMQNHSTQLALHLARAGADVEVFHPGKMSDATACLSPLSDAGVRLTPVPWPRIPRFPGHYLLELWLYSLRVKEALENRRDPDWIYVQGLCGLALLDGPPPHSPRIAVNMHGLEMFQRAPSSRTRAEHWVLRPAARRSLGAADLVFSLGGKLTPILESLGVSRQVIRETSVGISEEWLVETALPPHSPRAMIFVGRDERRKGVEEVTVVLRELSRTERFTFEFVGPLSGRVPPDIPGVTCRGVITDRKLLMELLSTSDILVCPSWAEGMPTVILEAMARGLAVIATDVGAVRELVSANSGWLIEAGDSTALSLAMREALALSDDALHAKKRESLARVGAGFMWNDVATATLKTLTSWGNGTA